MARTKKVDQTEKRVHEILKEPYAWVVVPDPSGGFSAEILEFPGCIAEGDNADEVCRNLENAAIGWLSAQLEKGETIPPPLSQHDASGKFLLRLPRSLHARASKMAVIEGISLNQFITNAVAERMGAFVAAEQIRETIRAHSQGLAEWGFRNAWVIQGIHAVGSMAISQRGHGPLSYDTPHLIFETLAQVKSPERSQLKHSMPFDYGEPTGAIKGDTPKTLVNDEAPLGGH